MKHRAEWTAWAEKRRACLAEADFDREVIAIGSAQTRPPAPKYGNVQTEGEASKKQARRLSVLRLMAEAGQIRGLARQPEYVLLPKQVRECGELIERKMTYIADFVYEEWTSKGWRLVVEDAKGYATPGYVMKRKLMLSIHGIEIRET
jgi:hypothetical protein